MKSVSYIIAIGFISLSVFGFVGMLQPSDMVHAQTKCLASLVQNGACPPAENTVASAIFHTNAFKVFSTTVVLVAAVCSLISACAYLVLSLLQDNRLALPTHAERIQGFTLRYLAQHKQRTALVRLEHSPTS